MILPPLNRGLSPSSRSDIIGRHLNNGPMILPLRCTNYSLTLITSIMNNEFSTDSSSEPFIVATRVWCLVFLASLHCIVVRSSATPEMIAYRPRRALNISGSFHGEPAGLECSPPRTVHAGSGGSEPVNRLLRTLRNHFKPFLAFSVSLWPLKVTPTIMYATAEYGAKDKLCLCGIHIYLLKDIAYIHFSKYYSRCFDRICVLTIF